MIHIAPLFDLLAQPPHTQRLAHSAAAACATLESLIRAKHPGLLRDPSQFTMGDMIGRGAAGQVHRAQSAQGLPFAVKRIFVVDGPLAKLQPRDLVPMIAREIDALLRLRHRRVLQLAFVCVVQPQQQPQQQAAGPSEVRLVLQLMAGSLDKHMAALRQQPLRAYRVLAQVRDV